MKNRIKKHMVWPGKPIPERMGCKVHGEGLALCFSQMRKGEQPNFLQVMAAISDVSYLYGPKAGCLDCS